MTRFLHNLSAVLFYLLAGSFFVAYLLMKNLAFEPWPGWWMKVADIPLVLVAALYGGTSLYLSIQKSDGSSGVLGFLIGVPLFLLCALIIIVNFLPMF